MTPLRFLWNHLKALYTKFVDRVRHFAGNRGFLWRYYRCHQRGTSMSPEFTDEDEEDFWMIVFMEELFD